MANGLWIGAAIVLVIVVVGGIYLLGGMKVGQSGTPILLTDPPQVPAGTQSLTIQYSAVQAYYVNGTASGWVSATGSGTINLMQLQNTSVVIGTADVPDGASITQVRFNVTSANITVNGTSYAVTLPESEITANVTSSTTVNSTSSVLLDMSPTIITVFTTNQTLFIMVPSVKGVLIGNASARAGGSISSWEHGKLNGVIPNITITSSSLAANNQTTDLSLTVKNNGNQSVTLGEVVLYGSEGSHVPPTINLTTGANIGMGLGQQALHTSASAYSMMSQRFGMVSFIVLSNRTLSTPDSQCSPVYGSNSRMMPQCDGFLGYSQNSTGAYGLNLQPGQSATLTFDSNIVQGYGMWTLTPVAGDTYQIGVMGSEGAHTSTSTTAT